MFHDKIVLMSQLNSVLLTVYASPNHPNSPGDTLIFLDTKAVMIWAGVKLLNSILFRFSEKNDYCFGYGDIC